MAPAPASPTREGTALLAGWVGRALEAEPAAWFETTLATLAREAGERDLGRAVGLAPRKLGKSDLVLAAGDLERAEAVRAGFDPAGLTVDQAARIAFLLAADRGDDAAFAARLLDLFRTADVSESIAYLRGLPLFPGGRALLPVAAEGVRSAVKPVFEAIAHRNPYPAEMFEEGAWNQMVLKALFIGSSLAPIRGLGERANPELAQVLVDYAHERWAAGRPVSPELWLCVGPFAEGPMLDDLARVLTTGTMEER
ncbi:MAG: EboA domain-containing protein, partial [Microvirga sp.]